MMMMSTSSRKRSNNTQIEFLVEKLHANRAMAQGNWGDPCIKDYWLELSMHLNQRGCARDVKEWQHIWTTWVTKVRVKARKIRDSISGTGGGPPVTSLSDLEEKILEISGRAAIFGFAELETEVRPNTSTNDVCHSPILSNSTPLLAAPQHEQTSQQQSLTPKRRRLTRPSRARRLDPAGATAAMLENGRLLHHGMLSIAEALKDVAVAIREHQK